MQKYWDKYFDLRMDCIDHAGTYTDNPSVHKYWMAHYSKLARLCVRMDK